MLVAELKSTKAAIKINATNVVDTAIKARYIAYRVKFLYERKFV